MHSGADLIVSVPDFTVSDAETVVFVPEMMLSVPETTVSSAEKMLLRPRWLDPTASTAGNAVQGLEGECGPRLPNRVDVVLSSDRTKGMLSHFQSPLSLPRRAPRLVRFQSRQRRPRCRTGMIS